MKGSILGLVTLAIIFRNLLLFKKYRIRNFSKKWKVNKRKKPPNNNFEKIGNYSAFLKYKDSNNFTTPNLLWINLSNLRPNHGNNVHFSINSYFSLNVKWSLGFVCMFFLNSDKISYKILLLFGVEWTLFEVILYVFICSFLNHRSSQKRMKKCTNWKIYFCGHPPLLHTPMNNLIHTN